MEGGAHGTFYFFIVLDFLVNDWREVDIPAGADVILLDDRVDAVLLRPPDCVAVQLACAVTIAMEGCCRLQAAVDIRWHGFTAIHLANGNKLSLNSLEILGVVR